MLREWRQRRRMSQLDLAVEAEVSAKHVSFVETGRAAPSREMLLHLAQQLAIPLRERNMLLVAAGYAPIFPERPLDDPALELARQAIEHILGGHEPYPALAVDRHWRLVAANRAVALLLAGVAPALLEPPLNVMRVCLHPDGLAPRIANLDQVRPHLLERLRQQIDLTADAELIALLAELRGYAQLPPPSHTPPAPLLSSVALPVQFRTEAGLLSLFSTTMVFGTPVDITLSELAVELFFPADAATAQLLWRMQPPAALG